MDSIVGTIVTSPKIAKEAKASNLGNKLWMIVGKTAVILEVAGMAVELGESVFKMLTEKQEE